MFLPHPKILAQLGNKTFQTHPGVNSGTKFLPKVFLSAFPLNQKFSKKNFTLFFLPPQSQYPTSHPVECSSSMDLDHNLKLSNEILGEISSFFNVIMIYY